MPNISALAILICKGKSSQNALSEIPRLNLPEFPGSAFRLVVITIFFLQTPNFPEFSCISLERPFGIPKSQFQGKMKLICWEAVKIREKGKGDGEGGGWVGQEKEAATQYPSVFKTTL